MHDKDFGIEREWDIDLISGYDHVFVKNTSTAPGSHHYKGIINPFLITEVAAFQPEKIIVYGWKFKSHLQLMHHFKGKIPLYFRGDSTLLDEPAGFSLKKALRKLLLQWVYRHVDFALSPGTASDAYFLNAGLSAYQIIRAPHAVDNARFSGAETPDMHSSYDESAQNWRKELSILENAERAAQCMRISQSITSFSGDCRCIKSNHFAILDDQVNIPVLYKFKKGTVNNNQWFFISDKILSWGKAPA